MAYFFVAATMANQSTNQSRLVVYFWFFVEDIRRERGRKEIVGI
jgi:hypothetical protein